MFNYNIEFVYSIVVIDSSTTTENRQSMGDAVVGFRFSFSRKKFKLGGGATKPKKVQNTDAKLREEYRSLKQKLLLAKRNGGNKKRIR